MYQTANSKIKNFFLDLITRYLVWIIISFILIVWYFFPELIESLGQFFIFWGPMIILFISLLIALTSNYFKFKSKFVQGIAQYEIIVGKFELYLTDLLIYLGSISILLIAHLLKADGADIVDVIQAFLFFIIAHWIKQAFTRKIIE
ncbi:MAG: hypothetical protein NTZ49_03505 [Candidatus Parcubacteria bacterium]|nr:hypothetical protein [Candidatus Parcubacteria bacterium]